MNTHTNKRQHNVHKESLFPTKNQTNSITIQSTYYTLHTSREDWTVSSNSWTFFIILCFSMANTVKFRLLRERNNHQYKDSNKAKR